MAENSFLEFQRLIHAPTEQVYRAFTSANAWQEWLCDVAEAAPVVQGRLYWFWQQQQYYACGHYVSLGPNEHVTFVWQGMGDPFVTQVHVVFMPAQSGTQLTLTHSGIPADEAGARLRQAIREGWETGLENLQSVLETGIDLRVARLPFMGIMPAAPNTPELAQSLGIPVSYGLQINGAVAGTGADAAGLQRGDMLVEMAGAKLETFQSLAPILRQKQAGDNVPLTFYRGAEKHTVMLTLSARPSPDVPDTAPALAARLTEMYAQLDAELEAMLQGISEELANRSPAAEEWSIKQVLAHLLCGERDLQNWITCEVVDTARAGFASNDPVRLNAAIATHGSVHALLAALKVAESETVALVAGLPDAFVARKSAYLRIGQGVLFTPLHNHDHMEQIRAIMAAAPA